MIPVCVWGDDPFTSPIRGVYDALVLAVGRSRSRMRFRERRKWSKMPRPDFSSSGAGLCDSRLSDSTRLETSALPRHVDISGRFAASRT